MASRKPANSPSKRFSIVGNPLPSIAEDPLAQATACSPPTLAPSTSTSQPPSIDTQQSTSSSIAASKMKSKSSRKKTRQKATKRSSQATSDLSTPSTNSAATIRPASMVSPSASIGTQSSMIGIGIARTRGGINDYNVNNDTAGYGSSYGTMDEATPRARRVGTLESFPSLDGESESENENENATEGKQEDDGARRSFSTLSNIFTFTNPFRNNRASDATEPIDYQQEQEQEQGGQKEGGGIKQERGYDQEEQGYKTDQSESETIIHHTRHVIDQTSVHHRRVNSDHPYLDPRLGLLPGGSRLYQELYDSSGEEEEYADEEEYYPVNPWADLKWWAYSIAEIIVFVFGSLGIGVGLGALIKWYLWDWIEDQLCGGHCTIFDH